MITGDQTSNGYRYYLRFRTKQGHWYRIRDVDAGVRLYEKKGRVMTSWVGGLRTAGTDLHTGLTVGISHDSATHYEPRGYDPLLSKIERQTGRSVLAMSTDKAGSINSAYYQQAMAGRAVVSERRSHPTWKTSDYDTIDYDRHTWRCPTCRHEARRIGVVRRNDGMAIKFRCVPQPEPRCGVFERTITEDRATDLGLISRMDPVWLALHYQHFSGAERPHGLARRRYNVAAKVKENAPERVGNHVQYLYSLVALIFDATKYCLRMGYLDSPDAVVKPPARANADIVNLTELAEAELEALLVERRKVGLHRPYGPGAARYGGQLLPPSQHRFYAECRIKLDPDTGEILDETPPATRGEHDGHVKRSGRSHKDRNDATSTPDDRGTTGDAGGGRDGPSSQPV
ncbi:MAG: hypothetical protein JWQ18_29 [Conexibacter sp.]|nr:hypothetical protein [Conexibacter sp.]